MVFLFKSNNLPKWVPLCVCLWRGGSRVMRGVCGLHSVYGPLVSKTTVRFEFFILVKKQVSNKSHMKMFFQILVTRKISLCLGWAFEVVSESLGISTIIDFYWWINKLLDYMWNVTLLNIWYDRSKSKIGVVSETIWAVRFVFETTPDIFGFLCIFFFRGSNTYKGSK